MTKDENIISMPDRERIKQEAGEWVARQDTRDLTPEEEASFHAWRGQSDVHREEFDRIADAWDQCDLLDELNYVDVIAERPTPMRVPALMARRPLLSAMAASFVVVMIGAALYAQMALRTPLQSGAFHTALGEQKTITLADGSSLVLNTDSAVEMRYTREGRDIRLLRGEAHFDVAKNKHRPFSVYAGDEVVRAVGTAFAVRLQETAAVEVTVSEGRVALFANQPLPAPEPVIEMMAGEIAIVKKAKVEKLEELAGAALERKLAWRRGLISFAGDSLGDAVAEISRYADYRIDIADPALQDVTVGGYFRVGEVEPFLRALEDAFDIGVERIDATHVRLYVKEG